MTDDRFTLADVREAIDAEQCERERSDRPWCVNHEHRWLFEDTSCDGAPVELMGAAEQMLATVERVQALADQWDHTLTWAGHLMSGSEKEIYQGELRNMRTAINGCDHD